MPSTPTPASEPTDRDPHDPEDAAAIVVDTLVAERHHHATDGRLVEEAEQAARDVEEVEDAE
jgi:hypothetical protein